MTINEAFAKRANEIAKQKNISKYKISQETGLYPSTINYIFHAKAKASNFKSMALIIRALDLSINEFFESSVFDFDNLDIE